MTKISPETQELLKRERLEPSSDLYKFVVHLDGQDRSIRTIAGLLRSTISRVVMRVRAGGWMVAPQPKRSPIAAASHPSLIAGLPLTPEV